MRIIVCLAVLVVSCADAVAQETRQATGVKVGEVTPDSAIVWMRLTAQSTPVKGDGADADPDKIDSLRGAAPGAAGRVRVVYGLKEDLSDARAANWVDVSEKTDFTHQFRLKDLKPASTYHFAAETTGPGGKPEHAPLKGRFRTAPPSDAKADVSFTVVTGQAFKDLDHADGFHIYEAMGKLRPHFLVPTGDTVYYDNDPPLANSVALARHHWHRMYSLPRHVRFHLDVPGCWEKDDHDTLINDCWPTMKPGKMAPLTFEEGLKIFREQVPMGENTYRTYRWGKGLQVWLVEGRDFRSPNNRKDGPDKTIWGKEQKDWLFRTIKDSDADWKVLVSPTPIVGPDRGAKADNHANAAFSHEGDEVRSWIQKNAPDNLFLACGDRHWQYYSVHPKTGVQEFSCGPASDQHAGGSPGLDREYHKFHRVKGGFLSVSVTWKDGKSVIAFRLHDVEGKVMHEYQPTRKE